MYSTSKCYSVYVLYMSMNVEFSCRYISLLSSIFVRRKVVLDFQKTKCEHVSSAQQKSPLINSKYANLCLLSVFRSQWSRLCLYVCLVFLLLICECVFCYSLLLLLFFLSFLLSFNPNILRIKLTLVYSRLDRCQSVCLSVCLYVYPFVCLFFFLSFFCVRHEQFWCGYAAARGWRVLNLIKTWDSKKGQEDGW